MAFWGIEVKPGNPYTHFSKPSKGRLHISQATLGIGSGTNKSLVQCNVGDKYPVFLCALLPGKTESCGLDLEFEEAQDVVFSVIGPLSVHLTGYYLHSRPRLGGDEESESYGEDIANSDNEESDHCSEDDDYEDSFIDDGDVKHHSPSPISNDRDINEENGVGKPTKEKSRKRLKKKHQVDEPVGSDVPQPKTNVNRRSRALIVESDDDDFAPVSLCDTSIRESVKKKQAEGEQKEENFEASKNNGKSLSMGNGSTVRDQQITMGIDLKRSSPDEADEKEGPKTKKVKKDHLVEVQEGNPVKKSDDVDNESHMCNKLQPQFENGVKQSELTKKKKKKKTKVLQDNDEVHMPLLHGENGNEIPGEIKGSVCKPSASQIKTLSNGLIIEELQEGKEGGKVACRGKKVKIKYVGKLKNGSVFETNIDESPYKFRLGAGKVIDGWDIGIEGMTAGGKRRLTIPPALGYGSQGNGENIPPDSWLIYEIELVSAR
uniref:peptidylprolyl isomerase n=1 Tax=Kalanchoe fedtschenkoi TaxID=63787 RepID=A0A7N0ZTQ6_KALFE